MTILKISAEFGGTPEDVFNAARTATETFGSAAFGKLKSRTPLTIQFIDDDQDPQLQKLLEAPIEELDLGVRTYNVLRRIRVQTLGDLVKLSANDLESAPNFGPRAVAKIREELKRHNLHLRDE